MNKTIIPGRWAARLSLVLGLIYSIVQILALLHWIPSPYDLIGMFIPSLLLAPAFLVTMACLHYSMENEARLFSFTGAGFALLYCALVSIVYFTQLASIIPLQLRNAAIAPQLLFNGSSIMVAIDCLGYGFMSLATLFTAFAFTQHRWLYRSLLLHGLLAPVIIASFFFPLLLAAGALWMITFPLAMIQVLKLFGIHTSEKKKAVLPRLRANHSY